jgi:2-polyprenyl-3-methyl-5-hydroxy-6-metoxy-1,4-benzoquinol methylase
MVFQRNRAEQHERTSTMQAIEHLTLELQKEHWKYWNSTIGGRPESPLRPLRRAEKILAYLRSLHLDQPTILDMGCGMGWFAAKLSQFGPTMGIDLCDEAIALAKSKFPQVTFQAGNLFEIALPERHFDVVVSQEVIAHVPDQCGYVERAARVLKPDGYLIMTTPNWFVHCRSRWAPIPPGHIEQWLTRRGLKRLLHPYFRVLRTTTAGPLGHGGILRLVNSTKLNRLLASIVSPNQLDSLKEWAGLGWTQIVLARTKS